MSRIENNSSDNIPESFLGVSDEFKEWFYKVTGRKIVPYVPQNIEPNLEQISPLPKISAKEIVEREQLPFEQRYGMEDPDPIISRWERRRPL